MRGAIGSLNAAVAGSILLFEAVGQREPGRLIVEPEATSPQAPEATPVRKPRRSKKAETLAEASLGEPAEGLLPGGPPVEEGTS
jgi:hypothetical protein